MQLSTESAVDRHSAASKCRPLIALNSSSRSSCSGAAPAVEAQLIICVKLQPPSCPNPLQSSAQRFIAIADSIAALSRPSCPVRSRRCAGGVARLGHTACEVEDGCCEGVGYGVLVVGVSGSSRRPVRVVGEGGKPLPLLDSAGIQVPESEGTRGEGGREGGREEERERELERKRHR